MHGQWNGVLPCDLGVSGCGEVGHFPRIGIVADLPGGGSIVHPHEISAGALRHDADEVFRRAKFRAQVFGKASKVVGREQRRSVVVHGIVRQYGQGLAVQCFCGEQGETRIDGTGRTDGIRTQVAGVHVGADVGGAKRVHEQLVGTADPAPIEGMVPIIHVGPAHPGRLKMLYRPEDRFGNFLWQQGGVFRINATAQTGHCGGG